MTKTEQVKKKDFDPTKMGKEENCFSDVNQSVKKYFGNVESYIPQYFESVAELQQQYFQVCENLIKTNLSLQQEFTTNTGLKTFYPEFFQQYFHDQSHFIELVREGGETMTLKNIELFKQFAKIWNENAKKNTDFNKNLVESWAPVVKAARKEEQ